MSSSLKPTPLRSLPGSLRLPPQEYYLPSCLKPTQQLPSITSQGMFLSRRTEVAKWRTEVANRSGEQKWQTEVANGSGEWKWRTEVANGSGEWKWRTANGERQIANVSGECVIIIYF